MELPGLGLETLRTDHSVNDYTHAIAWTIFSASMPPPPAGKHLEVVIEFGSAPWVLEAVGRGDLDEGLHDIRLTDPAEVRVKDNQPQHRQHIDDTTGEVRDTAMVSINHSAPFFPEMY